MPKSKKEISFNVDHDGMSTKGKQEGARKYNSQWSGLKTKVVTEFLKTALGCGGFLESSYAMSA